MNREASLALLNFLEVNDKDNPEGMLKNIIRQFQIKIPFETATKILTYKSMMPKDILYYQTSLTEYVESLKKYGYGGTCFNFTKGLFDLLSSLDYEVHIIKLDPGHFCLAVKVNQSEFFVDVGFMAPLFDLYPLREDWEVNKYQETIKWQYKNNKGTFTLHNGYTKKIWNGEYVDKQSFNDHWKMSYNENSTFIQNLFITRWKNLEEIITVHERTFKSFYKGKKVEENILNEDKDLERVLTELFNVDPSIYFAALKEKKGMVLK